MVSSCRFQARIDLGGKDSGDLLGAERLDRGVGQRSGAMDHRAQRVLGWNRGEKLLERLAVGDVAGGERRLRAQLLELCHQLLRLRLPWRRCG